MNTELLLVAVSALAPFIELRGSIPLGIALGYSPLLVFGLSIAANLLIIPILFFLLNNFFDFLRNLKTIGPMLLRFEKKIHSKLSHKVETYGIIALALFVAVPLPGSGAWSGSLAAFVFDLDQKRSMFAIAVGVVIAGILVTLASTGVIGALRFIL